MLWDGVQVARAQSPDSCLNFTTWFDVPAAAAPGLHTISVSDGGARGPDVTLGSFDVTANK
jgi:hypothetical protein